MSSTRFSTDPDAPISQEKYLSSPEYAELRGLSGTAVAARAALLTDPAQRSLLWFLQARKLQTVAADVLKMFPERLGTCTMHELGAEAGRIYSAEESRRVRAELIDTLRNRAHPFPLADDDDDESPHANPPNGYAAAVFLEYCRERYEQEAEKFLIDLCINPRLSLRPERLAGFRFFDRMVGALIEYQRRSESQAAAAFAQTAISRRVGAALDKALLTRKIMIIEGLEGRGKTEAVKAWCAAHAGVARYVTLSGITGKSNVFREISRALGLGSGQSCKANEMQSRVADVLRRAGLLLVIDEAHWLFDPRPRMASRPELVDWLNTDLNNHGVHVALVCTPQFLESANQAAEQVKWNLWQFQRRAELVQLPEFNSEADLESVALKLYPELSPAAVDLMVGYALLSKRDISGLGDVVNEARLMASAAGRGKPTATDVKRAIDETLLPSDAAFAKRIHVDRQGRRKNQRRAAAAAPAPECGESESISETSPHVRAASAAAPPECGGRLEGSAQRRGITPFAGEEPARQSLDQAPPRRPAPGLVPV